LDFFTSATTTTERSFTMRKVLAALAVLSILAAGVGSAVAQPLPAHGSDPADYNSNCRGC
jgi:hypothetical protein